MGFKINQIKVDLGSYPHYVLLGNRKVGKSSWFRDLVIEKYGDPSKGLLISCGTENGYRALDNLQVEEALEFNAEYDEETGHRGFVQIVDDLVENNKEYGIKLVAIDTLDCYYDIAVAEVLRLSRKETGKVCKSLNDSFGGFGRGRARLIEIMTEQVSRLESAGIAVFIISHVKEKTRTDMVTGTEYQVWSNNLNDDIYNAFANTAQMVMMAVFDRNIVDKRVTDESRSMYLRQTATIDAGSRFAGLPEKIPFTPKAFLEAFELGVKNSATVKPITDSEFEKRKKNEIAEQEKNAEVALKKEKAGDDESHRDEWISLIQDKFVDADNEIKKQIKAINMKAGVKFNSPDFPIDLLKEAAALLT